MIREARLTGDIEKYMAFNTTSEGEALLEKKQSAGSIPPVQKAQGWGLENNCPHQGYQRLSPRGPPSYVEKMEMIFQRPPEQTACSVLAVDQC